MGRINIEKHAKKFMWAIDRGGGAKTELPKTVDEYLALASSVLRPILQKRLGERPHDPEPFAVQEEM